jgi:hypothetical protein
MSTPPVPLSPECDLARDHEPLHRLCHSGADIPLPDARPHEPLLAKAWCECGCHATAHEQGGCLPPVG